MGYGARIEKDSVTPDGARITTYEVVIPRIVLAEFNTHCMLARNSASSRAIPVKKMIAAVMEDPYIPEVWGSNKKGMQAGDEVSKDVQTRAKAEWLRARDYAVEQANALLAFGIHKQLTNRLLEPWLWHTIIVTATEWNNFEHLRNNAQAHPAIAVPAAMMQELREESEPTTLGYDEWHLPFVTNEEIDAISEPPVYWVKVSVGRCARVSYLTHDGVRDPRADVELHDKLLSSGHMSPFEHVARPATTEDTRTAMFKLADLRSGAGDRWVEPRNQWSGKFRGWVQYRKMIAGEHDMMGDR